MAGKLSFLVGFGAGYVLGARSGRERYEQIAEKAQQVWRDPRVQEKAGQAQQFVGEKAGQAGHVMQDKAEQAGQVVKEKVASAGSSTADASTAEPGTGPGAEGASSSASTDRGMLP